MRKPLVILAASSILAIAASATPASAAVTVNVLQNASGVTATANGTFDISGLSTYAKSGSYSLGVYAEDAFITFANGSIDAYTGLAGPANFGPGTGSVNAGAATGSVFGLNGLYGAIFVPAGFVSGGSISSSEIFAGQTLASLGLTPGVYSYTSPKDTLTINIGLAVPRGVPEPATWAMMLLGFCGIGFVVRKRKTIQAQLV